MLLIFVLHSELYLTLLTVTANEVRDRLGDVTNLLILMNMVQLIGGENESLMPDMLPTGIYLYQI